MVFWVPESIPHRRHAEHQVQVLLHTLHKGGLDGQLGGGVPSGLKKGPHGPRNLLQVLWPHQVGHLATVQHVVDVLHETSKHLCSDKLYNGISKLHLNHA